jgi:hypothetical protein
LLYATTTTLTTQLVLYRIGKPFFTLSITQVRRVFTGPLKSRDFGVGTNVTFCKPTAHIKCVRGYCTVQYRWRLIRYVLIYLKCLIKDILPGTRFRTAVKWSERKSVAIKHENKYTFIINLKWSLNLISVLQIRFISVLWMKTWKLWDYEQSLVVL